MIRNYEELVERVKRTGRKKRVVVAASHDGHTLEALATACREGLVEPLLIGRAAETRALIRQMDLPFHQAELLDAADDGDAARKTVAAIREGRADFIMKGKLLTADLLKEVVNRETGLPHGALMSHVGFFEVPGYHKLLVITDGGMVPTPDLGKKRVILENAVTLLGQLGYDRPKVAALCAAEVVNPKIQASVDAAALKELYVQGEIRGCIVEGPISYDLMLSREAACIKGYESPVTGETDILLVPDMTAGNLMAKALMLSAGAKMAGVIVGASAPIVLVSRGASAEEKYLSLVLAAAVDSK